ncbi:hypothetical protein CA7LBN_002443 [Candidozyma auris]|uniref:A to I editase domain-containing protein n=1 Tax=Candidozyma auris TaxID=498019 RepID=A0A8F2W2G7_CANAR|nr:hypothetical protein CA7LBN_002443 [[Candida] auris]
MFGNDYNAFQEINEEIAPEQLQILKNQLESENPQTPDSQFNYAWGLLKTKNSRQQKQGMDILTVLYRDVPRKRRDSLYYLALGSVKLGEYSNARRYAEALLEKEPNNSQFQSLKKAIDDRVTEDGLIGLGVAGGVLAVGLGIMGAPRVRDNGVREWTVLAGLVSVDEKENIEVISLATGVKALPDQVRKYSNGWVVHDMHAEILCLRMFNYLVLKDVVRDRGGEDLVFLERENSKLKLKRKIKLALFISEPPCGDASMSYVAQGREAWEERPEEPAAKKQKNESSITINRGRAGFDKLGVVRTKPGRADSNVTLSKSCSDKLCLRQEVGILNSINSFLVDPVYLDYLVLPKEKFREDDFERCFGRIEIEKGKKLVPLVYDKDSYKFHKSPGSVPSPVSLVSSPASSIVQVLSNGAKYGGFVKNKPPKPSGSSILCNQNMARMIKQHPEFQQFNSYLDIKQASERHHLKASLEAALGDWIPTTPDNFLL